MIASSRSLGDKPIDIPIIFIMGTTATGKTDAAAYLSTQLPVEIISVDSSLVYRGMDIGSAKPDKVFLKKYPHHLVDIRDPDQAYSAADFVEDSVQLIKQITQRGYIPLLVGGTSFYFSALEQGLPDLPAANQSVRARILQQADERGWEYLHTKLAKLDPKSAKRINISDPQRIQRALEIIEITGNNVVPLHQTKKAVENPILKFSLAFSDRKLLHKRIETRFQMMLDAGLIEEVQHLLEQNFDPTISAFKMIGYRQIIDFLEEKINFDRMIESGNAATRQLAKRQLTWLRNQSEVVWLVNDQCLIDKNYKGLLTYIKSYIGL